jgi:hypothetical protein
MSDTGGNGRDSGGRFAKGNSGGPGRPRRSVEREYLAALSEELSLTRWQKIVRKAIDDAETGDWRAREWLAKIALGPDPKVETMSHHGAMRLLDLVVDEAKGETIDATISARVVSDRVRDVAFEEPFGG